MEYNKLAYFKLNGNFHENFKLFKQKVEVYFTATEAYAKGNEVKVVKWLI